MQDKDTERNQAPKHGSRKEETAQAFDAIKETERKGRLQQTMRLHKMVVVRK